MNNSLKEKPTETIAEVAASKHIGPIAEQEVRSETSISSKHDESPNKAGTKLAVGHEHKESVLKRILIWTAFLSVVGAALYYFRGELLGPKTPISVEEGAKLVVAEYSSWDGLVTMSADAEQAIGVTTAKVLRQTEPILLPILGTTKHDETKMSKVLPLFKGRAEKVYVSVGDKVELGAPLVELYSADLAQAKTSFEIEKSQWEYVKRLLDVRVQLRASNSISEQLLLETQNDELRQKHEFDIAREKLVLFGLNDAEIGMVASEQGAARARLTVRAPASGVVIARNVVSGNIYDDGDIMLAIAPNDHLSVWGNVFEHDLDLVEIGQKWDVRFGFLDNNLAGIVEYISPNVDPAAHAVKIRTTIPNPGGKLKADMLVQGNLQVAPHPDHFVIPRIAMVVVDGSSYCFTRDSTQPGKFARHRLMVVHEKEDMVIVRDGLKLSDEVVVLGSLILQQLYEEKDMLVSGHSSRSIGAHD
jgi:membrane fusion protein, heavy metal efflux system